MKKIKTLLLFAETKLHSIVLWYMSWKVHGRVVTEMSHLPCLIHLGRSRY